MKSISTLLLFISGIALYAQNTNRSIRFELTYEGNKIDIGERVFSQNNQDSISIETLKFYMSNLLFYYDEKCVDTMTEKHLLIDLGKKNSDDFILLDGINTEFHEIRFQLGIDSTTNSSGALGSDLDPTKGMYWTWQSGYINFKLEGYSKACPARNHFFQFHIGGFQHPFQTLQNLELKVNNADKILINVAIDQLIEKIDLHETYEIMSPSVKAVEVSSFLPSIFNTVR